jgi:SRSO17 transposase
MMPITKFLSCTDPLDQFESLSYHQTQHAKTYVTGLVAGRNKTVTGIAREVLPANSERALNKFLAEYDWDEEQLNHERLEELQKHGETRWAQDGYIIIDDTINQKAGDEVPGVGHFYDHAEGDTVWGQNIVYAFYADEKTAYPLAFRLYEDGDSKLDLAREIIAELEEEVGVPAGTYLFDSWYAHDSGLIEHIESYEKDWIGPLRSNRQVTYDQEEMRVDALAERIDTTERKINGDTYNIWTKKLHVSKLGDVKSVIAEKETEEAEDNPVRYLVSNKVDAPTEHVIRSYSKRWRIETFFEDSKQDLGFGDCELQRDEGASRHWYLLMLAYSLLYLGSASSVLGTVRSTASSLRAALKHSLKEAVYKVFSWVRDNRDRDIDDLMQQIDHLFINVRG